MEGPLCPPSDPGFRLIETFRWEPGKGILRRARHLARLARSAARLGIVPRGVDAGLEALAGEVPLRVRLTVDRAGQVEVTSAPYVPLPEGTVWRVAIADQRLSPDDPWLGLKTTQRQVYDAVRAELSEDVDEVIFLNNRGEICEGTITNLFLHTRYEVLTPCLSSGLLPGILREEMLASGNAIASVLTPDSLRSAETFLVGNSLRGLIPALLV